MEISSQGAKWERTSRWMTKLGRKSLVWLDGKALLATIKRVSIDLPRHDRKFLVLLRTGEEIWVNEENLARTLTEPNS